MRAPANLMCQLQVTAVMAYDYVPACTMYRVDISVQLQLQTSTTDPLLTDQEILTKFLTLSLTV